MKTKFKIGDFAYLKANPLDEQLGESIPIGLKTITDIKDTNHLSHTSGQWVKIAEHNDWLDSEWFAELPPLPDDDVEKLLIKEYPLTGSVSIDARNYLRKEGFIAGYKAAKSESGFSESDVINAIGFGQKNKFTSPEDAEIQTDKYLQSLTAQWEFVPEEKRQVNIDMNGNNQPEYVIINNVMQGKWKLKQLEQ
jgi:hypothetical protein